MKRRAMVLSGGGPDAGRRHGACAKKPRRSRGRRRRQPRHGPRKPPGPPQPVDEPVPVPPEPVPEDAVGREVARRSQPRLAAHAGVLRARQRRSHRPTRRRRCRRTPACSSSTRTWQITIEGHCDERGSAEYNLALGERRAHRRPRLPRLARRRRQSGAHGQLRQGVSVRAGARGGGLVAEPARALRDHGEVAGAGGRLREG